MKTQLLLSLFVLVGCGIGEKSELLLECPSPDGSRIATIYYVSDGDRAVDRETKINVRPAASSLDDSMFSFSMRHGYDAIIHWKGNHQLELTYPEDSELIRVEHVIFGTSQTFRPDDRIRVHYIEQPSTHGYFMVEKRCFTSQPG